MLSWDKTNERTEQRVHKEKRASCTNNGGFIKI